MSVFPAGWRNEIPDVQFAEQAAAEAGAAAAQAVTENKLDRGGGTMTGALSVLAPSADAHAARRIDVNNAKAYQRTAEAVARTVQDLLSERYVSVKDFRFVAQSDDTLAIQNAISAARTLGIPCYFPPGTYTRAGDFIIDGATDLTIFADPGSVEITRPSGDSSSMMHLINCARVRVIGLKFDGKRRLGGGTGGTYYSLSFENCTDCEAAGCRFYDSWNLGVFAGCVRTAVRACRFEMGVGGVTVGGTYPTAGDTGGARLCRDTLIEGCFMHQVVEECVDINFDVDGCMIANCVMIDNYTKSDSPTSELIDVGGGICRNIVITGNLINNGTGSGNPVFAASAIHLKLGTTNYTISNNVIRNMRTDSGAGIELAAVSGLGVVSGNQISNVRRGVAAYNASGAYNNLSITGNTISDCTSDIILLQLVNGYAVSGNYLYNGAEQALDIENSDFGCVTGNTIRTTTNNAIWVRSGSSGVVVSGNNISTARAGVVIEGSGSTAVVTGNDISNMGVVSIQNSSPGVTISGNAATTVADGIINSAANCIISGNRVHNVTGSGKFGLTLNAGSDSCIVTDNLLCDLRSTGRTMQGGLNIAASIDFCVVKNNIARNCTTVNAQGWANLGANCLGGVADNITA